MAIGFGVLGLEPRAFWSLTLSEVDAAIRGRFGAIGVQRPPSRREFERLTHLFPDA